MNYTSCQEICDLLNCTYGLQDSDVDAEIPCSRPCCPEVPSYTCAIYETEDDGLAMALLTFAVFCALVVMVFVVCYPKSSRLDSKSDLIFSQTS